MKDKLTILTIALAVFAPISLFIFVVVADLLETLFDFAFLKVAMYSYFNWGKEINLLYSPDYSTILIFGSVFTLLCYGTLFWLLRKMHTRMKAGEVSERVFNYTALLTLIPLSVVFIAIVGSILGIGGD